MQSIATSKAINVLLYGVILSVRIDCCRWKSMLRFKKIVDNNVKSLIYSAPAESAYQSKNSDGATTGKFGMPG